MDPASSSHTRDYSFAKLSDLRHHVTFRIAFLQGKLPHPSYTEIAEKPELRHYGSPDGQDIYVTAQLYSGTKPQTLPFRTPWKDLSRSKTWNQTITLPITYPSLQTSSRIAFTIWDIQGTGKAVPVGGTTMKLFGTKGTLKRGQQRLYVHPSVAADPAVDGKTPSELPDKLAEQGDEMGRLESLVKDYERGDIPRVDWLDKIVFREIERIHSEQAATSPHMFLYVDLPKFDFPIAFAEQETPPPLPPQPIPNLAPVHQVPSPLPANLLSSDPHLWKINDPDAWRDNPVEAKYRKLMRSHRAGAAGKDLKPGPAERDRLNEIFRLPPTATLSLADKDLLWKYRYSLPKSPRSLTKFLKSVTWTDAAETKEAVEVLLPLWESGTEVGVDDALELLGPGFMDSRVRAFAVKRLGKADDEDLLLYLLQLVQALKFEATSSTPPTPSRTHSNRKAKEPEVTSEADSGLAGFLTERSVRNPLLGTSFYWYLMVECDTRSPFGKMYAKVAFVYMTQLMETPEGALQRDELRRQGELVATLSTRAKEIKASKDPRPKKIDKLRGYIADPKHHLCPMPAPLTLPLDARVRVTSILAEKCNIFKSNLSPLLLWFQTEHPDGQEGDYPVIFKNGDDLRQDQLVIQLFSLMDRLLRKENLDLRLSPYSVLATSTNEGMVQFMPSKTLAGVMAEHGSLQNFMRVEHADDGALSSYGIDPVVLDTFVRSCAGYCVVTYVLGVGDRHLDNLMLAPDGHFFHVDFGYILGRDPKPYPPPVKISKEMVDAMGGPNSVHYTRFKGLCYTAFIGLRKNANLILNLIALMVDAGIQDIQLEPDKAVMKVQEKFMLDTSEEDAIKQFEALLNDTSYLTVVFDRIHDWAQYLRECESRTLIKTRPS